MKQKSLIILTAALLTITTATSVQTQPEKAVKNNAKFTLGEVEQQNFLEKFFNQFSLTVSDKTVSPGESVSFTANVEATENIDDISSLVKIVEVYRCDDPGCTDPNPFVEAVREGTSLQTSLSEGDSLGWSVEYTVPETESEYQAVAYLWDTDTNRIVSTTSVTGFEVTTSTGDTDSQNTPDIDVVNGPFASTSGQTVNSQVTLENRGGDMQENWILEMQVRPVGESPLSFVGQTQTCDPNHPENVHKEFRLDSGDQKTIKLSSTAPEPNQKYTVYMLTRSQCANSDGTQERVEPFPRAKNVDAVCAGSCETGGGNGAVDNPGLIAGFAAATVILVGGVLIVLS